MDWLLFLFIACGLLICYGYFIFLPILIADKKRAEVAKSNEINRQKWEEERKKAQEKYLQEQKEEQEKYLQQQKEKQEKYLQEQKEKRERKEKLRQLIYRLANSEFEISPEQFFKIIKASKNNSISTKSIVGVYILYNKTKDKYYVGQAHDLFARINTHFTGRGNGDVYADYKYGDLFTIRIIRLKDGGELTLNQLEKTTIMAFNAYKNGYNKTRGNS